MELDLAERAEQRIERTLAELATSTPEAAQFSAKDTLNSLGHSVAAILLFEIGNALRSPRFTGVGELYFARFVERKPYPAHALDDAKTVFAIDAPPALAAV